MDVDSRLFVALDTAELDRARRLVEMLTPVVRRFKIGSELFTAAGPAALAMVHQAGGEVFLDLKFHDIPATVAGAARAAAALGVFMFNVHAAGGEEMMAQAREGVRGSGRLPPPLVLGVTLLTSADRRVLAEEMRVGEEPGTYVLRMARAAHAAGLDGVVASAQEAPAIKAACGASFVVVAPGIRPAGADAQDQRRTLTPGEALRAGCDFLVVGRPITRAPDPRDAARRILDEMAAGAR
ncbi:MAG: orotidine-5'-phosphate decarboxylase [Armatimonadetes bacterium]|nr:orotidine-5'-phosphate decarboxylase [Armatimonadota bacterium]